MNEAEAIIENGFDEGTIESERDQLTTKLASVIEPMKHTFLVARLRHEESLVARSICCSTAISVIAKATAIYLKAKDRLARGPTVIFLIIF